MHHTWSCCDPRQDRGGTEYDSNTTRRTAFSVRFGVRTMLDDVIAIFLGDFISNSPRFLNWESKDILLLHYIQNNLFFVWTWSLRVEIKFAHISVHGAQGPNGHYYMIITTLLHYYDLLLPCYCILISYYYHIAAWLLWRDFSSLHHYYVLVTWPNMKFITLLLLQLLPLLPIFISTLLPITPLLSSLSLCSPLTWRCCQRCETESGRNTYRYQQDARA